MGPSLPFRICSVQYLNAVPLTWGFADGPQRGAALVEYALPSACGDAVQDGNAQVGLVPVAEVARRRMDYAPGLGIGCLGAVRSILLISRRDDLRQIRTLAADNSSRTSVELVRIVLRERYGVQPAIVPHAPQLDEMLTTADAALIIGDPALRLDPGRIPYPSLDLGQEWLELTGLPFVFAVWAGASHNVARLTTLLQQSYEFGSARLDEIVHREHAKRGITAELATTYLTKHIRYRIGKQEAAGLQAFLELADLAESPVSQVL